MTDKISETVKVAHLDEESFDVWRDAMVEFEQTHEKCTLGTEYDHWDNVHYLAFTGNRDMTEAEIEAENIKKEAAERKIRIAEQKKKDQEDAYKEKAERRRAMFADPAYEEYKAFKLKYKDW